MKSVRLATVVLAISALSLFGQAREGVSERPVANDEVGAIDVVIVRKPQGIKFAETRITDGKPFSGNLPSGEYLIVMSWPAPVRANAKSFFESRSNVSNIAAPGWQLEPEADTGFAPGDWAQFERWPYAYAIAGQGVKKGKGAIEAVDGGRIQLVQEILVESRSGANVRGIVRAAKPPRTAIRPGQGTYDRVPIGDLNTGGMGRQTPAYSLGTIQGLDTPQASAKEIDGIDVIIKKKPQGNNVAAFQLKKGEPLNTKFPPGEYILVMSWPSPVKSRTADGAQLKSFFESRSNVSNIAAPGWQLTPGAEVGFAPAEWAQFERWPYAYAISGNGVQKGGGYIDYQGDRVYLVQEIVVSVATNVRAMVRPAAPGPVKANPNDGARPVH